MIYSTAFRFRLATLLLMPIQPLSSFYKAASALISDPSTSNALRQRIEVDMVRDPIDALADAEALHELARIRAQEVFTAHKASLPE
ncbi:hypothetical protein P245_20230 [Comamonas thiooxydans]|uniref:Uncharacterized protein n=1 Tax=Comamonas thiooxydans TaxID=363952 RepID=A0A0E3BB57_9BURK|nr:hypothetical protein P245_20230 [Comamonas thiooxydans]